MSIVDNNNVKKEENAQDNDQLIREKIKELPLKQRIRVVALYCQYLKKVEMDKKFDKEVEVIGLNQEIEQKFDALEAPLIQKQQAIIAGERAPDAEDLELVREVLDDKEKEQVEQLIADSKAEKLQDYWLKAFQNCDVIPDEMSKSDEPILKHLKKIFVTKDGDNKTITFEFEENEFFSNTTLVKKIFMLNEDEPSHSEGTEIQWKDGKDVTKKIIKKKQRNKKTGQTRVIEKTVQDKSFFNFFRPFDMREEHFDNLDDEEAQEMEDNMQVQMEIAEILVMDVVPMSLEFYLGINEKDEFDGEGDSDEDDDEDSDDDSEDEKPKGKKKKSTEAQDKQQKCDQQ